MIAYLKDFVHRGHWKNHGEEFCCLYHWSRQNETQSFTRNNKSITMTGIGPSHTWFLLFNITKSAVSNSCHIGKRLICSYWSLMERWLASSVESTKTSGIQHNVWHFVHLHSLLLERRNYSIPTQIEFDAIGDTKTKIESRSTHYRGRAMQRRFTFQWRHLTINHDWLLHLLIYFIPDVDNRRVS